MVQAIGNKIAGGASGGWLKAPNLVIESLVKSEIMRPPPKGTIIARAIRQILPQVDSLVVDFLFDIFVSFLLILIIT